MTRQQIINTSHQLTEDGHPAQAALSGTKFLQHPTINLSPQAFSRGLRPLSLNYASAVRISPKQSTQVVLFEDIE